MAIGRITKRSVDALAKGASEQFLWDDEVKGFGLKVTTAGAKSYVFQYRLGGRGARTQRVTMGKHGNLTPDDARKEAKRLAVLVGQGLDIVQDKRDRQRQAVDLAFRVYLSRFSEQCLKIKWPASHADALATLTRYANPVLGDKPINTITRADMRAVLDQEKIKKRGATRRNLFAFLRRMFNWAISEGDIKESPLTGMEAPPLPQSRDRVLDDGELRLAWITSGKMDYPFGPLIRLLISTGKRLEEVSGLDWKELDRASAMWSLPGSRSKNKDGHECPLSALAIAELDGMAKGDTWPRRGFVFTTTGETSVSGHSRAKTRIDKAMAEIGAKEAKERGEEAEDVPHWKLHDLRRTVATGLQRLGVRFEVTEAVLNHLSGSKSGIAGVYQRHDWKAEKRAALDAWAVHIERSLVAGDTTNVIPMPVQANA
ncbi:tyrosine-type recombinase/integrase [Sphingobium boeckii]|uniref:Integrase n=1 Tax=Sphingobium boeckii TaxID=1082345 RepID=A0A7W9AH90_9SPHN|nr:integrase family protein [Sphingobium boeckii]MBB5685658.1 integrase [Sphingobium boeckii]